MRGEHERLDLERPDAYGRSFGDVYDRWYDGVTDAGATARFVAGRHPGGAVLELGVGTGRLAGPMADRGLTVVGLDASPLMLARCPRAGTSGLGSVLRVRADMRALPFARDGGSGRIGTVLVAFNTLFNLATEADQRSLLHHLAALVGTWGSVVVEALDVTPLLDGPTGSIGIRDRSTDPLVVTATQLDRASQRVTGQHVEIGGDGVTLRPWVLRWLTPAQLDELAAGAGLALAERWGSWSGDPFTEGSGSHISLYRASDAD
jgi:SAM-dependent methyltransferase